MRQERYDAFTAAFEHIAAEIDSIFKDLTRSRCVLVTKTCIHMDVIYSRAGIIL